MFVDRFGVVCADVEGECDEVFFTGGLFSFLSLLISKKTNKKHLT